MANEINNNVVYTNISDLPLRSNTASGNAYVAVETQNKSGFKMDLSTLTEDKIKNLPQYSSLTANEKTAFLGDATVPAIGKTSQNAVPEIRQIGIKTLVPTDNKSIQYVNDKLQLKGMENANNSEFPFKTNQGLAWGSLQSQLSMGMTIDEDSGGEYKCDPVFITAGIQFEDSANGFYSKGFQHNYEAMPPLPETSTVVSFINKANISTGDIINLHPVIVVDRNDLEPVYEKDNNGDLVRDEEGDPIQATDFNGNKEYKSIIHYHYEWRLPDTNE